MHIKELLSIPAAVLLIVSVATTQAVAQGTLSAGSVNGRAGQAAAVPITMNVGTAQVVNFSATFSVVAQGGAPAIMDKLTYAATTPPGAPQLTDDTVTGSFAIGYVNDISPPLTGTHVVGTLMVPIPAGATGGSYQVQALNVSALDPSGNDVSITGQSGTITLPVGGNTLTAGDVNGQAGQTASVPITLKVGTAQVVNFAATFSVVAQGCAVAITDKLTYQAATPPGPPQLTDDSVTGSFAIGYINDISPPLTGTLIVGTLRVSIPAGATGTYQVRVLNVSALDPDGNDVSIMGQNATITLPLAGNTLSAGNVDGQPGQTASVPITMNVGAAQVVDFAATFSVVAQGCAAAVTDKLTYQAATPPGPPQLTDDSVTGLFAIGYINDISPPLTGTLIVGTLRVSIPAGATGSYLVQVLNVSALGPIASNVCITGEPGKITLSTITPTTTATTTARPTSTPTATVPPGSPTPTPPTIVLRLGDVAMAPGDHRVPTPVFLENSVGIRGVQFDVKAVPAQVTLHPTPAFQCVVGSRAADVPCQANQKDNDVINPIAVIFLSTTDADISPGSDQIVTLFVDDATPFCSLGSVVQLQLANPVVSGNRGQLTTTTVNGSINCGCDGPALCGCKGDVVESKETDIFDVLRCVDFAIRRFTPTDQELGLTDLPTQGPTAPACDGKINVADCLGIVDVILGRLPPCPACS